MVVLVRCSDSTCTLALESRVKDLIKEGLIVEVLRNGTWVPAMRPVTRVETIQPAMLHGSVTALASSF